MQSEYPHMQFISIFILDPDIKAAIREAIISSDAGIAPSESSPKTPSSDTSASTSGSSSQVDWNFLENHSPKSLADKNLDYFFYVQL